MILAGKRIDISGRSSSRGESGVRTPMSRCRDVIRGTPLRPVWHQGPAAGPGGRGRIHPWCSGLPKAGARRGRVQADGDGEKTLVRHLETLADDDEARFGLCAIRFLRAFEKIASSQIRGRDKPATTAGLTQLRQAKSLPIIVDGFDILLTESRPTKLPGSRILLVHSENMTTGSDPVQ